MGYCFSQFRHVRSPFVLWLCQVPDDLALASIIHLTIAIEGCHYLFMAKVLTPCLERLWSLAEGFAEPDERVSKAMRVEIGKTGFFKCLFKDFANRRGISPVFSVHPNGFKLPLSILFNPRGWK